MDACYNYLCAVCAMRHIRALHDDMGIHLSSATLSLMHDSIDEAVWLLKQALLQDSALAPKVLRKLHELRTLRRMFRSMVAWDPPTTVAEACEVTAEDSDFLCALDM